MAEFKDSVEHTGGVLTIHKQGHGYSLSYSHVSSKRLALVELVAVDGEPVEFVPMNAPEQQAPQRRVLTMLPTDEEGLYGRRCPNCGSYFRASHPFTRHCPYCDATAKEIAFFTDSQREFIRRQFDAIVRAMEGADRDTAINFDAQIAAPTREGAWVYSEEKQQTLFKCSSCRTEFDVLGLYVRCPQCAKRTAREVIERKLSDLSTDFEADAANIPKEQREQRQRRWRHYVPGCVAEFEALGRDVAVVLSRLPGVPSRRAAIASLSFQNVTSAAAKLHEWIGFDIFQGLSDSDKAFLHRMFNRRHLFAHCGGKVDQEYLDSTGDTTVRLHQIIDVDSKEVRRLINLVKHVALNLLDGFETIG